MSEWTPKDGSGNLFANKKKTAENNQPNAKGLAMIGGVLYEVAAWTKTSSKSGEKFQSLSFKPKGQYQNNPPPQPPAPAYDEPPTCANEDPF